MSRNRTRLSCLAFSGLLDFLLSCRALTDKERTFALIWINILGLKSIWVRLESSLSVTRLIIIIGNLLPRLKNLLNVNPWVQARLALVVIDCVLRCGIWKSSQGVHSHVHTEQHLPLIIMTSHNIHIQFWLQILRNVCTPTKPLHCY